MTKLDEKLNIHSTNIDVLRFVAAALVIISHSSPLSRNVGDILERTTGKFFSIGGLSVAVFFFLSGMYVTKSLEKTDSIGHFLLKRVKRIFPQMIVLTMATVFILGPFVTTLPLSEYFSSAQTYRYLINAVLIPVHDLPGVFTHNPYLPTVNGALWTMPLEFACYLVLAFAAWVAWLSGKNRKTFDILIFVIISVIYLGCGYVLGSTYLVVVIRPVMCFFEGVLFYDYRKAVKLSPVAGIICLIAILLLMPVKVVMAVFFLFPYAVASIALGLPQLKRRPDLCNASYEMYLVGFPIQQTLVYEIGHMSPTMNWVIALPIDIAIGYLFYRVMKHVN